MSDRSYRLRFTSDWDSSFDLIVSALEKADVRVVHPTEGVIYFLPPDGELRRVFDREADSIGSGSVQFWVSENEDVLVAWNPSSKGSQFDVALSGLTVQTEVKVLATLYTEFRDFAYPKFASGLVIEIFLE